MKVKLDHIGWVTKDIQRFEDFWVKGLGFEKVWEAKIMPEKTLALFNIHAAALALRYKREDITIEVHGFPNAVSIDDSESERVFERFGINHISLHVENRNEFIKELSEKVQYLEVRRFHDPSGWDNIFIRDYDGNWIELRETL